MPGAPSASGGCTRRSDPARCSRRAAAGPTCSSPCASPASSRRCWRASSAGSPMAIDRAEAARIAELARLAVPEAELARIAEQLSQVLEFVAALDELDLVDGEPTAFAPAGEPLRADLPDGRTLGTERATAGAPESEDGFFPAPPLVEESHP